MAFDLEIIHTKDCIIVFKILLDNISVKCKIMYNFGAYICECIENKFIIFE